MCKFEIQKKVSFTHPTTHAEQDISFSRQSHLRHISKTLKKSTRINFPQLYMQNDFSNELDDFIPVKSKKILLRFVVLSR